MTTKNQSHKKETPNGVFVKKCMSKIPRKETGGPGNPGIILPKTPVSRNKKARISIKIIVVEI
jgi:hypothetical protein